MNRKQIKDSATRAVHFYVVALTFPILLYVVIPILEWISELRAKEDGQ